MRPRCICGHPHDTHVHHRTGSDCGACSGQFCPAYIPIGSPVPPSHALAAAFSDAHTYRNLAALEQFTLRRPAPVPAQRKPSGSIAGRYAQHLRTATRRHP